MHQQDCATKCSFLPLDNRRLLLQQSDNTGSNCAGAAHLRLEEVAEEGHCSPCICLISPDPQNGVVGDYVGLHVSPQQLLE